ncbi:hypothetical protein PSAC2689_20327 [Paraburkholderia sacchari]
MVEARFNGLLDYASLTVPEKTDEFSEDD